jgi:thioredoxin reductase (NADPH)
MHHYDVIVIGGGSGGLAFAREAKKANPGLNIAVFDYVTPTQHGTKWGLGGTCVNVGCIPKKLMHYSGSFPDTCKSAENLGWSVEKKHNWGSMVEKITDYIKSINFSLKNQLVKSGIDYFNFKAYFVNKNTVTYKDKKGEVVLVSANKIVIACGCRPHFPNNIENSKLAISSDDLFWRKQEPGKTLIVGGSYIALETASFLNGLGYDVTVSFRSKLLRGFDEQSAYQIGELLERAGIRFRKDTPTRLIKDGERYTVYFPSSVETYDTVIMATGRHIKDLNVTDVGIIMDDSGKIIVNEKEETNVENIYAIGDVCSGRPELTPVAIKAGQLLARRLYGNSLELMNYNNIPTCVFTQPEYGCCGYTYEQAEKKYGEVEVYLSRYNILENATMDGYDDNRTSFLFSSQEWYRAYCAKNNLNFKEEEDARYGTSPCLAKLICYNDYIIGFHYIGPNAGEITQGFALAMSIKTTKHDLDRIPGIHPTSAEEFISLENTLETGFLKKEGCGGGGSCG